MQIPHWAGGILALDVVCERVCVVFFLCVSSAELPNTPRSERTSHGLPASPLLTRSQQHEPGGGEKKLGWWVKAIKDAQMKCLFVCFQCYIKLNSLLFNELIADKYQKQN